MEVRVAGPEDAEAVCAAYLDSWRAGYDGLLPDDQIEIEAIRRAQFDWRAATNGEDRVRVAVEGPRVLGVIQYGTSSAEPIDREDIEMLYVVPDAWGTGAAKALLDAALDDFRQLGRSRVWLRVVEPQTRARRFYEREGWSPDPEMPPASNGLFRLIYYRRDLTT